MMYRGNWQYVVHHITQRFYEWALHVCAYKLDQVLRPGLIKWRLVLPKGTTFLSIVISLLL